MQGVRRSTFDHPFVNISFLIIFYILYLDHLLTINATYITIFPNPLYSVLIILFMIAHTTSLQEFEHHTVTGPDILQLHGLALIPPFIGAKFLNEQITLEQARNNDKLYILGLQIIRVLLLFFGIIFVMFVLSILFQGNVKILFLPFASSFGFTGISLGLVLTQIIPSSSRWDNQFRNGLLLFFSLFSKNRRARITLNICSILFIIIAIVLDFRYLPQITI